MQPAPDIGVVAARPTSGKAGVLFELQNAGFSVPAFYCSPSDLPAGAAPLLSLVGTKIEKVAYDTSGRLELFFSNSKILILLDDSNDHESYTISHGDDLIVV